MKAITIAIDGPAGAGKSTVAKALAQRLGYIYIDTGAMYRAVTYYLQQQGVPVTDDAGVCKVMPGLSVRIKDGQVAVNSTDVTAFLRSDEVSAAVSTVAAYPCVREHLVHEQRVMAARGGVVMDGRDIGTVVLPAAELKVFLTASAEVRARRRWKQNEQAGMPMTGTLADLQAAIVLRDKKDSEREVSPLRKAADARLLDNSELTAEETVERMADWAKQVMQDVH